jgi:hypothetical protein
MDLLHACRALLPAAIVLPGLIGCAAQRNVAPSAAPEFATPPVRMVPAPQYIADPNPDRVGTILFATISPLYLLDKAEYFGSNGVDGIMMSGLMGSWHSDVWTNNRFTDDPPGTRVVGAQNSLVKLCKRMNDRCRRAGIEYNSVEISVSQPVPDWFDDAGWARIAENFRQGAIFAREAGFAGISFDHEYISDWYLLRNPIYAEPGYPPESEIRRQVQKRGFEIMSAMLDEFPDMIFWLLPENPDNYDGWLGVDMFVGLTRGMAERDAPGGLHLSTERSYLNTRPRGLATINTWTSASAVYALNRAATPQTLDYWMRRCGLNMGIWPLGFYYEFKDSTGKPYGYTGKRATYPGEWVGSYSDKTENYPVSNFEWQFAAARSLSRRFMWIYCHGTVLWRMTPEEMIRYRATPNDTLPTVWNLPEYLRILRERPVMQDPLFEAAAALIREHRGFPRYSGFAPRWCHIGPFPNYMDNFDIAYPPEQRVDLRATYRSDPSYGDSLGSIGWREVPTDTSGYVDLTALLGKRGIPLAYSAAWVEVPSKRQVWFRFGSNDYGRVYVNGRQVHDIREQRAAAIDDDSFPVELPAGRSQILVKCGDAGGKRWGFYLRITDEAGREIPGLRWVGP